MFISAHCFIFQSVVARIHCFKTYGKAEVSWQKGHGREKLLTSGQPGSWGRKGVERDPELVSLLHFCSIWTPSLLDGAACVQGEFTPSVYCLTC